MTSSRNYRTTRICVSALVLGLFAVAGCGSSDSGGKSDTGAPAAAGVYGESCKAADQTQYCDLNQDCGAHEFCGKGRVCTACEPCAKLTDCNSANGEICDSNLKCCFKPQCNAGDDCEDARACVESVCREQCCVDETSCDRAGAGCLKPAGSAAEDLGYCIKPGCMSGADCSESNLCDMTTYTCKACSSSADCLDPALTCDAGKCVGSETSDGDSETVLSADCDQYKTTCLYELLLPLEHILNPPGSNTMEMWQDCREVQNPLNPAVKGRQFKFANGDYWVRWGDFEHEALLSTGDSFNSYIRIVFDQAASKTAYRYFNPEMTVTYGWYGYDSAAQTIKVICPLEGGGTKDYLIDVTQLVSCAGYARNGYYLPPTEEGCQDMPTRK